MTTKFDKAFNFMIKNEGGFADYPEDRGGVTNFGISYKFLKSVEHHHACTTTSDRKYFIKNMTIEQAKAIYKKHMWREAYEEIRQQELVNCVFDMCVHHGHKKAVEIVQRAYNAFMLTQDLDCDGLFGANTINALNEFSGSNGYVDDHAYGELISCMIAVRESLCRCIAAHDKSQRKFLAGWIKRCYKMGA
jgi:lysozyme family protein